jgi:hypothetical protein
LEQILGRIFRLGSDTSIKRIIIDIVDVNTPVRKQWDERVKEYIRRNLNIFE